jgi:hypothetical protein
MELKWGVEKHRFTGILKYLKLISNCNVLLIEY